MRLAQRAHQLRMAREQTNLDLICCHPVIPGKEVPLRR